MGKVEDNLKNILNDIKNSRFEYQMPKKELILMITRYTTNYYPYLNRLWIEGYIRINNENVVEIITTTFKENNNGAVVQCDAS